MIFFFFIGERKVTLTSGCNFEVQLPYIPYLSWNVFWMNDKWRKHKKIIEVYYKNFEIKKIIRKREKENKKYNEKHFFTDFYLINEVYLNYMEEM